MAEKEYIPCGGCGARHPKERCIGCMHSFTKEEEEKLQKRRDEIDERREIEAFLAFREIQSQFFKMTREDFSKWLYKNYAITKQPNT